MEMDTLDCNLSPKITPFLCNKEVEEETKIYTEMHFISYAKWC